MGCELIVLKAWSIVQLTRVDLFVVVFKSKFCCGVCHLTVNNERTRTCPEGNVANKKSTNFPQVWSCKYFVIMRCELALKAWSITQLATHNATQSKKESRRCNIVQQRSTKSLWIPLANIVFVDRESATSFPVASSLWFSFELTYRMISFLHTQQTTGARVPLKKG